MKVSIIRDRGQLTIPDSIRRVVSWITPMSAVSISVIKPDEIVIKPHQKQVNWDQVWENIRKSRAISGRGNLSAADFLEQDRRSH
ncbi:MAG: hypothetical protein A2782_00100 [Candidatus Blackburnbacteria bacterium RIFCSPHIGHO2_01_FULL_43_15b]|uniref:Uncharacterized protein n=1 Tax=Candidatus Blackburnbacteria bacterium RIFCSPHIGHO2_01_FULL_43_15b TaxID=1797513 RepID=A0A1G1V140_9BACT|nr:MAG: hypothetical protein A2782_00100 [Candidatus Blackburnbacteria bacterium RIFCSPHIGHO2_01_FULL_43_15b]